MTTVPPPAIVHADTCTTIWHGDCRTVLATLSDNSVDAVIGDPPYNLEFMEHAWDTFGGSGVAFQAWCQTWAVECLRVLKPGGHMLMFGGSRTWHRLACAVEDAGFEIRDSIAWLHSQGMPKSLNLHGEWEGWGTTLKPAFEPIVVARKPLQGTVASNVAVHGTGALHVDACRVGDGSESKTRDGEASRASRYARKGATSFAATPGVRVGPNGRWPTNVALDQVIAAKLDEQTGTVTVPLRTVSRFFPVFHYQAKAPAKERPTVDGVTHPTPKPLALIRWLTRLVTPVGGLVLDPFAGSGTTVEACLLEGFQCIAIEQAAQYLPLIQARVRRAA